MSALVLVLRHCVPLSCHLKCDFRPALRSALGRDSMLFRVCESSSLRLDTTTAPCCFVRLGHSLDLLDLLPLVRAYSAIQQKTRVLTYRPKMYRGPEFIFGTRFRGLDSATPTTSRDYHDQQPRSKVPIPFECVRGEYPTGLTRRLLDTQP